MRRIVIVLERSSWDPFAPGDEYTGLLAEVAAGRQSAGYKRRTAEYLVASKVKAAKSRPRKKAAKRPVVKPSRSPAKKVSASARP